MDEITGIELIREVLLGERKLKLPKNSVQTKREQHKSWHQQRQPPNLHIMKIKSQQSITY